MVKELINLEIDSVFCTNTKYYRINFYMYEDSKLLCSIQVQMVSGVSTLTVS